MAALESKGDAAMRESNYYRPAGDRQFGVKRADIRNLAKQIKSNHELGLELWATGNLDAMLLASLILKPKLLSAEDLSRMVGETFHPQAVDWFGKNVVAKSPHVDALFGGWRRSDHEMTARMGWWLSSRRVGTDLVDHDALLDAIEAEMASAPAGKQEAMNWCLVEIGVKDASRRERAIAIGERLGVYRDYVVPKGCVASPYAPEWIAWALSQDAE